MQITVDILRSGNAYLAETEPFVGWNLHDAEDVEFCVVDKPRTQGECHTRVVGAHKFEFRIDISKRHHTHTDSLLRTMAHEMVHVHQRRNCINLTKRAHGQDFWALAAEVCTAHGFD